MKIHLRKNLAVAFLAPAALLFAFTFSMPVPAQADPLYIYGGGGGGAYVGNTASGGGKGGTPTGTGSVGEGGNAGGSNNATLIGGDDGTSGISNGGPGANGGATTITVNGGAGGSANYNDTEGTYDSLTMRGSSGGVTGDGGESGAGGGTFFMRTGDLTVNGNLFTEAGTGGQVDNNTNAGQGGALGFEVSGKVDITGDAHFAAGSGGNYTSGTGDVGNGGDAEVTIGGRLTVTGTLDVFGGIVQTTSNAQGGDGGNMAFMVGSMQVTGAATFRGGLDGGGAKSGDTTVTITDNSQTNIFGSSLNVEGQGGNFVDAGGSVTWDNANADVQVDGNFTLTAGDGHATGTGTGGNAVFAAKTLALNGTNTVAGGDGGMAEGGNVSLSAQTLLLGGSTSVNSGNGGTAVAGTVTVDADTLRSTNDAAAINVTKGNSNGGVINFNADTVDASQNSLSLSFTTTSNAAGDSVTLGNLIVGNGKSLLVQDASVGGINFTGGLTVLAYDPADPNTLKTSTYGGNDGSANFVGKYINFVFPENVAASSTILTNGGAALVIDNSTRVSLTMVGTGGPQLVNGDSITLIDNIGTSVYTARQSIVQGSAYKYDFTVESDDGNVSQHTLIATFNGRAFDPDAGHNFLLGRTGGFTLTREGGDIAVNALDNAYVLSGSQCFNGRRYAPATGATCPDT